MSRQDYDRSSLKFPIASGDTLFNFSQDSKHGQSMSGMKRNFESEARSDSKRSRFEDPLHNEMGSQPGDAPEELARNMLNYLAGNSKDRSVGSDYGKHSLLGNPGASLHDGRYERGNVNPTFNYDSVARPRTDFGFSNSQGSQWGGSGRVTDLDRKHGFGNEQSFGSSNRRGFPDSANKFGGKRDDGMPSLLERKAQPPYNRSQQPARSQGRPNKSLNSKQRKQMKRALAYKESKAKESAEKMALEKSTEAATATTMELSTMAKDSDEPKDTDTPSGKDQLSPSAPQPQGSVKEPSITIAVSGQEGSKVERSASFEKSIIKPKSIKDRLNTQPNIHPLMADPAGTRKPVKSRLDLNSGARSSFNRDVQAFDDFLLGSPVRSGQKSALLADPDNPNIRRQGQVSTAPRPALPPSHGGVNNPQGHVDTTSLTPRAMELARMRRGIPHLLRSIKSGNEPVFSKDQHNLRSDYILMATKTSASIQGHMHVSAASMPKFARIRAVDEPDDAQVGIYKHGRHSFPAFSKAQQPHPSVVPSVSFLKTNQWNPGYEKSAAPMTVLQKEVAAFNIALYQLMKSRSQLMKKISKGMDPSIRLIDDESTEELSTNKQGSKTKLVKDESTTNGSAQATMESDKTAIADETVLVEETVLGETTDAVETTEAENAAGETAVANGSSAKVETSEPMEMDKSKEMEAQVDKDDWEYFDEYTDPLIEIGGSVGDKGSLALEERAGSPSIVTTAACSDEDAVLKGNKVVEASDDTREPGLMVNVDDGKTPHLAKAPANSEEDDTPNCKQNSKVADSSKIDASESNDGISMESKIVETAPTVEKVEVSLPTVSDGDSSTTTGEESKVQPNDSAAADTESTSITPTRVTRSRISKT